LLSQRARGELGRAIHGLRPRRALRGARCLGECVDAPLELFDAGAQVWIGGRALHDRVAIRAFRDRRGELLLERRDALDEIVRGAFRGALAIGRRARRGGMSLHEQVRSDAAASGREQ